VTQDEPAVIEDEFEPRLARRHALWALGALGCAAVIVGALMLFLGGGGTQHHAINLLPPVHTPSSSSSHAVAGHSTHSAHSLSASPSDALPSTSAGPIRHGNPCPSSAPCVVDGDGGALAAVDAYRTAHGLPAVPGDVTHNAQVCALNRGNGSTCVPHYAWTSVPAQDGAKAVGKITGFGSDWLLDKSIKTISVGWAYVNGAYECVLLKAP
jgi:hypothetical protein